MKNEYRIIGVMSGTSLDGLDLAYCSFYKENNLWQYRVLNAITIPYNSSFKEKLAKAVTVSALEFANLNVEMGNFIAASIKEFINKFELKPDYIASHGHTVFHQPQNGLTSQIGSGAVIAAKTGISTIADFRTVDVALGGQGAPLVPVGDELLFGEYDACLNLGGFSNISYRHNNKRVAFDISPCNMALNRISNMLDIDYDKDGELAKSGFPDSELLEKLNKLEFYALSGAKSLSFEWFENRFWPFIQDSTLSITDKLRTVTEHIAIQLARICENIDGENILVTGGGAKNLFLVYRLSQLCTKKVVIPDSQTVDYKEAIIFAFLGLLRIKNQVNCLKEVTGASANSCCGALYAANVDEQ